MNFLVLTYFFFLAKGLSHAIYHSLSKSTTKAELKRLGFVFVLWFLPIPDDGAQKAPREHAELAWEGAGAVASHGMPVVRGTLCPCWTDHVHAAADTSKFSSTSGCGVS